MTARFPSRPPAAYAPRMTTSSLPRWISLLAGLITLAVAARADSLQLRTRSRPRTAADTNLWELREQTVQWESSRTAVVVCDMWDKHHCPDATERVGEMAPRMNEMLKVARSRGCLIIHCPSDTMDFYKDHPGRKLAQAAPKVTTNLPLENWCSLKPDQEAPLPIDDSDGGCDGCPDCPSFKAWSRQHPALEVQPGDAITDSAEAFYLMRQRGITNVIVMGVHINMCVLGRPFSIRQMVRQGQNVVLVRDLTDSMYNHRKRPFVSHFRGTELVVEHIEKFWCPSITSSDFVGGTPFRFQGDRPKHVALIIGENEYRTWETLPAFARQHLEFRGYRVSLVSASPTEGDGEFKNVEAIRDADLVVVSVRRRAPQPALLQALRTHLAAGKPLVGIRTASHAFELRGQTNPTDRTWPAFDEEILGADYQDHYGKGPGKDTVARLVPEAAAHPVLTGIPAETRFTSHLYRNRKLFPTVTPLLSGQTENGKSEVEPLAWVNTRDQRRVFYTSLGSPEDFADPAFQRLLLNGILWALDDFIPPAAATAPAAKPAKPSASTSPAPGKPSLPLQTEALPPATAAKTFEVFPDLAWDLVLSEPEIAQPVFLTFDERGRMWVVEYRQYPHPAGLKMVSRDHFWRAVYDKVPPAPPHHFKGADRITVHEDSDGDGTYDRHKTFVDGLNIATSVAFGRGGVWVLNPPYLLFYPDANQDDVPDGDPEVRLSGFGLEDTHSVANSLRWGPDGWLYGCQGSTVTGNIRVHGPDGKPGAEKPVYSQGQNLWRYHPARRIYEVFSEGGGNAFGLEFDSAGRAFSGHNGGNTRGFHYQQGAYLQKGFEKHGPLSNPHAYGYFPQMPHPDVARFTHNFVLYDSGALGDAYRGRLFGVEPLQGRIVMSEIRPDGSTFRTRDLGYPVRSSDPWFRPVDIKLGPDGALYVCDWYDRQVNHYRNHEGQIDPATGRVYRLRRRDLPAGAVPSLSTAAGPLARTNLVSALGHTNRLVRQQALRLLADRPDPAVIPALRAQLNRSPEANGPDVALEALWALNQLGALDNVLAATALRHRDPQVRLWTARLLGDTRHIVPALCRQLAGMAATEPDVEVRSQLASTARRMPPAQSLAVVRGLISHDEDASDLRLPLLVWWAIEQHCTTHREAVLQLFSDRELWRAPMVQQHLLHRLARRLTSGGRPDDLLGCARLFDLSPNSESTARLTRGFEEATQGSPLPALPEELIRAMEKAGGESLLIGTRRGRPDAVGNALKKIQDEKAPAPERVQLVQVLGETREASAVPVLLTLVRDSKSTDVRRAALGALQAHEDAAIATELLAQLPAHPAEVRPITLATLASRARWTEALLLALDAGRILVDAVPLEIARKIKAFPGESIARLTSKLWPRLRQPTSAELEQEIHRLTEVVNLTTGSPYTGKKLFLERCGTCHKLFNRGGEVGPDLTVYQRTDLANLLLNIVNPNAEIREGFESFQAETKDERVLVGFMASQTPQVVVLRTPDGQSVPLQRSEITSLTPAGSSLMPEGLLGGLGDQQVRDLFAYLRSTQPLND